MSTTIMKIGAIILAAGKSTRMKSDTPKVMHLLCGLPVVTFPVEAAIKSGAGHTALVISSECRKGFAGLFGGKKSVELAIQREQKGTGDAVKAARAAIGGSCEHVFIIPGDVPLIRPETLKQLYLATTSKNAVCGVLTMEPSDPASYGRIVRDNTGFVKAIVEARDANTSELMIREVNSSIYCVKTEWLFEAIKKITPQNSKREYYLTDIIKIAVAEGHAVVAQCITDANEAMGINTRRELTQANRLMRLRILSSLMEEGVGIINEDCTYIDCGVKIGPDTTIFPNTFISGKTVIGHHCRIETGAVIKDSVIGNGVHIKPYSAIEDSIIKDNSQIGPFARLRPGTIVEDGARIGNFVEVKKSTIRRGAKANHLSYIGDAVVGERTNVGCGTITCNYDGRDKHKTIIGNDVFIGSDVQFVAPVKIGNNALIGAGSTITADVPANALAIARGNQIIKKNWAKK